MGSDEDYIVEFRKLFAESIKCRLRSAFPIGFDLSGGLDSSSIVCMAKNILEKNDHYHQDCLNTFSYVFDEFPQIDERYYIKKIVEKNGIKAHYIFCDDTSPLEHIDIVLSNQNQPHFNPFLSIMKNSFEKMHEKGIRTVLSGGGGDDVIYTGSNYFSGLAITFQWYSLLKELRGSSKVMNDSLYKKFIFRVCYPLIPDNFIKLIKKIICHWTKIPCPTSNLNKDFENKLETRGYKKYFKGTKKLYKARDYHYFSITNGSAQKYFEIIDLTSDTFNIDTRYPYYDKRLIEFCYAIPDKMKFRLWNRFIQRIAMDGIIPSEIQWRVDKASLRPFLAKNLLLFEEKNLDNIINNNEVIKEYIDFAKFKDIYIKYKGNKNVSYNDIYYLWIVLILFFWLKKTNIPKN